MLNKAFRKQYLKCLGVNGSPHISVDFMKCLHRHLQTVQHLHSFMFNTEWKMSYFRALKSSSLQQSTTDLTNKVFLIAHHTVCNWLLLESRGWNLNYEFSLRQDIFKFVWPAIKLGLKHYIIINSVFQAPRHISIQ